MKSIYSLFRSLVLLYFWVALSMHGIAQSLFINEIQVANIDQIIDPSFNYGGWIEFYNNSASEISLNGYSLKHINDQKEIKTAKLKSGHGTIPSHGFLNLWFDHNSIDGNFSSEAVWQIPFKLDADGGTIILLNNNGKEVCRADYPAAIARCSWARTTDGGTTWGMTAEPTPQASNAASTFASQRLEAPQVDIQSTLFSGTITIQVSKSKESTLYYTTDGSTPTATHGQISTDGRFSFSQTTILRLVLCQQGYLPSQVITHSYIQSNSSYYLPIVSISTAPENLYDDMIGVYTVGKNGVADNGTSFMSNINMDWERPINFEYFEPNAKGGYELKINQEVSFKNAGGYSRHQSKGCGFAYRPSFKLSCNKVFEGNKYYDYNCFTGKPYVRQKSLLVRNGGQDTRARIKDIAIQEIIQSSGLYIDWQAWRPSHVFLNGKYLGMMNLREPSNKNYAYSNYGIDTDHINQFENGLKIKEGSIAPFLRWDSIASVLAQDPQNTKAYAQLLDLVDIDEYCNYMATESYIGNTDFISSRDLKNIKGFCATEDKGKIHIVLYDIDQAFNTTKAAESSRVINDLFANEAGILIRIFKNMMKVPSFRKKYIDTFCLLAGSVFEPERSKKIIAQIANEINPALAFEGSSSNSSVNELNSAISGHRQKKFENLRKTLKLDAGYQVNLSSNVEDARLLLNNTEVPTNRFAGTLFSPIELKAMAPADSKFLYWEVNGQKNSSSETLKVDPLLTSGKELNIVAKYEHISSQTITPPIRINEIGSNNDIFVNEYSKRNDWIELYNLTDKAIDLEGLYLSDNEKNTNKYKITQESANINLIIPPHGFSVIWCDKLEPVSQIHSNFKLDNKKGALVMIQAADGSWADRLVYDQLQRWETYGRYPDGGNFTTILHQPTIGRANGLGSYSALTEPENLGSYTLSISDAGWATLCVPFSFEIPNGITLYTVKGTNESFLLLEPVKTPIANKPYLASGAQGKYTISGEIITGNNLQNGLLIGTLSDQYAPRDSYVLQEQDDIVGFYQVNKDNEIPISAHHAYLKVNSSTKSSLFFPGGLNNEPISIADTAESYSYFNLWGLPVKAPANSTFYIRKKRN